MEKIWLSSPHMSNEGYEKQYIKEAFDLNWVAPAGENITQFENDVVNYVECGHAVALSSGTSAIHLGLKALGVKSGDLVACQSFTFSASANPIKYLGAEPVFIGSDKESWNLDPKALEEALKENESIKVVIVVNLYGGSAKYDEIINICKKYDVKILEDAAESLGSKYKGKFTGTFGDVGIFSFNGNKIITSSGGGMLVTPNKQIRDKVQFWSTQSKEPAPHYEHKELGYNYRLSNISAGIGRGQMKVLENRVKKKKYIYEQYIENLADFDSITFKNPIDYDKPNYWLSCALFKNNKLKEKVLNTLLNNNIEARPLWKPMHLQPYFQNSLYYGDRYEEQLFDLGLCLPSDTKMDDTQISKVIATIREVLNDEI